MVMVNGRARSPGPSSYRPAAPSEGRTFSSELSPALFPVSRSLFPALSFQAAPSPRLSLAISCAAHLAPLGPWSQDLWSTLQTLINSGRHPTGSGRARNPFTSLERARPGAGIGQGKNERKWVYLPKGS